MPARAGGGRSAAAGCAGRRRRACRSRAGAGRRRRARPTVAAPSSAWTARCATASGPGRRGVRQLVLPDGAAGDVRNRGEDPGRGDVERRDVRRVRGSRRTAGRAGRARRAVLPLATTSPAASSRVSSWDGGRLGQPGELAEPGARERAVLEEQVEGGAVVDAAEQAGGARPHRPSPALAGGAGAGRRRRGSRRRSCPARARRSATRARRRRTGCRVRRTGRACGRRRCSAASRSGTRPDRRRSCPCRSGR